MVLKIALFIYKLLISVLYLNVNIFVLRRVNWVADDHFIPLKDNMGLVLSACDNPSNQYNAIGLAPKI